MKKKIIKELLASIISGITIGISDYFIWVYFPNNDILDAIIIGFSVFLMAFLGMRFKHIFK